MKRFSILAVAVVLAAWCSVGQADIISYDCVNDGDGAINCAVTGWTEVGSEYEMTIVGDQFWGPGHMNGNFYTDLPLDPTIKVINSVDNDTSFAWTDYHLNIYMTSLFTLSSQLVYTPGDWTASITSQPVWDGTRYKGQIDYYGGTEIAVGGTLDFGYKMSFDGATAYGYCQEMIPVGVIPEPGTLTLLVGGALGVGLAFARRRTVR